MFIICPNSYRIVYVNNTDKYTGIYSDNNTFLYTNDTKKINYISLTGITRILNNIVVIIKFNNNYYLVDDNHKILIPKHISLYSIKDFNYPFVYTDDKVIQIDENIWKTVFKYKNYINSTGIFVQYTDIDNINKCIIIKDNTNFIVLSNIKKLGYNSCFTDKHMITLINNKFMVFKHDDNIIGVQYNNISLDFIYNLIRDKQLIHINNLLYKSYINKKYYKLENNEFILINFDN